MRPIPAPRIGDSHDATLAREAYTADIAPLLDEDAQARARELLG